MDTFFFLRRKERINQLNLLSYLYIQTQLMNSFNTLRTNESIWETILKGFPVSLVVFHVLVRRFRLYRISTTTRQFH